MTAEPCALHIQIRQTVTPVSPGVFATYTVADLAQLWHRSPATIRVWLCILRKHPQWAPCTPYVQLVRRNAVRRELEIRSDYAQLLRSIFIDHRVKL